MAKIKITKEIKELNGEVIERSVSPFGTSAHIPFPKKHTGKIVDVVVPSNAQYTWVLSKEELNDIIYKCEKILSKKKESRILFLLKETVKNIKDKTFSLNDIIKVISILKEDKKNNKITEKLKYLYNL